MKATGSATGLWIIDQLVWWVEFGLLGKWLLVDQWLTDLLSLSLSLSLCELIIRSRFNMFTLTFIQPTK